MYNSSSFILHLSTYTDIARIALRILTPHPSSTQAQASLSSTSQLSTQILSRVCVQLLVDRPGPRLTSHFRPVLHPERVPFSQRLSVSPDAHPGWWPHGLLGMSSDIGGTRPGKYGRPSLRQAVPPAPLSSPYYCSPICPSSDSNPQSFPYSLCSGVSMSVGIWLTL